MFTVVLKTKDDVELSYPNSPEVKSWLASYRTNVFRNNATFIYAYI